MHVPCVKDIVIDFNSLIIIITLIVLTDLELEIGITTSFITKIKVKLNLQHKYINTKRGNIYSE